MVETTSSSHGLWRECVLLYSTQTGHSKACARRCSRIILESSLEYKKNLRINSVSSFDEYGIENFLSIGKDVLLICFVSTTGEGEHCDTIQEVWNYLKQKTCSKQLLSNLNFVLFCLGDYKYGDLFCLAGRKFYARMIQLGAKSILGDELGYGDEDDDTLRDLDLWLEKKVLSVLGLTKKSGNKQVLKVDIPFTCDFCDETPVNNYDASIISYLEHFAPLTAYATKEGKLPWLGRVILNKRLTEVDWKQDVRHICIEVNDNFMYKAGDVAVIYPRNSVKDVELFLSLLSPSIQANAEKFLNFTYSKDSNQFPSKCSFKSFLVHCADICSPPEREDLRLLSYYCTSNNNNQDMVEQERKKLLEMSDLEGSALYIDYIIRERRNWMDVLFDFNTICFPSINHILHLLPAMRSRHFSIASSPSECCKPNSFRIELCVARLYKKTHLKRDFFGLCSSFLCNLAIDESVRFWIRPGSFHQLPLKIESNSFKTPILCIGAGTGVAPLRGLLREREYIRRQAGFISSENVVDSFLLFGSRQKSQDFLYKNEWQSFNQTLKLFTAFSQDQNQKIYVQHILKQNLHQLVQNHLLEKRGAIYVAGNINMCKCIKEEIFSALSQIFLDNESDANKFLKHWKKIGLFRVEAWS